MSNNHATQPSDMLTDDLPESVIAAMQVRDRWFTATAPAANGRAFIIADLLRWLAGTTIQVAFLDGDPALHRDIATATEQITDACNLNFDFGHDPATGRYRSWSLEDTAHRADIRVSFDRPGYSSLIGRDAVTLMTGPDAPFGGRPNQRSLNLGGFTIQRPANWQGVVRHEFMHAVAFFHEHQHPGGGCDAQFRWEDDPGYLPTTNEQGRYIPDAAGRRPGAYTTFAGYPHYWPREKVDHNLRPRPGAGSVVGAFDSSSIMLYQLPDALYVQVPNPCTPTGNGIDLSDGDIVGLREAYPFEDAAASALNDRRSGLVDALSGIAELPDNLRAGLDNLTRRTASASAPRA